MIASLLHTHCKIKYLHWQSKSWYNFKICLNEKCNNLFTFWKAMRLFVCKSTGVRRHRHLPVLYSNQHHLVHCKRKRCLNCYLNKKKTVKGWDIFTYYKCELCNVPLCKTKDCFEMFHQRTDSQSYNEYQNSCWNTIRVWVVYQIICIQSDFFSILQP